MGIDTTHPPNEATVTFSGEQPVSAPAEAEIELEPGARVGRYLVIERIGSGAMGFVYAAYDPELDRKIAIKVLRAAAWQRGGRERALREAQAMAKLSHPNVVAVHDVGMLGDQLFVAMELVDGDTLRDWLTKAPRSWREVVRVSASAGRGIAAAHAAGVVHRDVKPDNILVSPSGSARVVDFGVAQDNEQRGECDRVAGTPAYMAPEQRAGAATAQSDQFAFCVTLSEALYGARPAALGTSLSSMTWSGPSRPTSGTPARSATGRPPARVRRALRRGLSEDPARRFPSMDALLAQLEPAPRRRRAATAVALLLVGSGGAAALLATGDDPAARCRQAATAVERVWSADRSAAIAAAFSTSGASFAADTARRVESLLDDRARAWATTRRGVCEATWLRGEQSESLLDVRMQCLDRRLNEMTALVELLSDDVDSDLLSRAVQATVSLAPVASCAEMVPAGADAYPTPTDPRLRARIDELHKRLDQLEVLISAGQYQRGVELAPPIRAEAEAIGYAPARAELMFVLGKLLGGAGEREQASALLAQGIVAAAEAREPRLAVRIAAQRVFVVGSSMARFSEAMALVPDLEAALVRAGDPPELRAAVERSIGAVHMTKGDYARARGHMERALALYEQTRADTDLPLVSTINNLGVILTSLGLHEAALPHLERAAATWEAELGADHPAVAIGLNNLGTAYQHVGRDDDALRVYQRALGLWERAHGPDHPDVAIALLNVGQVLSDKGEHTAAEARFRRALTICEHRLDPGHPNLGIALSFLGSALGDQGKHDEALPLHRRAVELLQGAVTEGSEFMGVALLGLGSALAAKGDAATAIDHLEHAVTALEGVKSTYLPKAQFELAQVSWRAGRDRERARQLADAARQAWAEQGNAHHVDEIDAWLSGRAPRSR